MVKIRQRASTRRGVNKIPTQAQESQERERVLCERIAELEKEKMQVEIRAQEVQRRAEEAQKRVEEAHRRAEEAQKREEEAQWRAEEAQRREERAEWAAQRRVEEAQRSEEGAQRRVRYLENRLEQVEMEVEDGNRRVQDAERRLLESARPSWVIERGEIQLTEEELGRGGWAAVKVAMFRGVKVAAKCLYRQIVSAYNRDLFIREMNVAARVRHPNLLQFIGATLEGEMIILTELMPTSLRAVLERGALPNHQILSISLDVARALNYLHLMKPDSIIHRDISSSNVLLEPLPNDSWRTKVSDYGSANFLQQLRTAGPGNPTYAAPEAYNPAQQSTKMDVFSFGVLLVEMCAARFPDVSVREQMIQSIEKPWLVTLIRQCTANDKDTRPTVANIIRELNEI